MSDPGPQKAPASLARIKAQLQSTLAEIEELIDPPQPFKEGDRVSFRDNVKVLHGTVVDNECNSWVSIVTDCGQRYQLHRRDLDLVLHTRPSHRPPQAYFDTGTAFYYSTSPPAKEPEFHQEFQCVPWRGLKVGDRVKPLIHGLYTHGTVSSILNNQKNLYSIRVVFDNNSYDYFKPEELEQLP